VARVKRIRRYGVASLIGATAWVSAGEEQIKKTTAISSPIRSDTIQPNSSLSGPVPNHRSVYLKSQSRISHPNLLLPKLTSEIPNLKALFQKQ
jgi:hypothetical protein